MFLIGLYTYVPVNTSRRRYFVSFVVNWTGYIWNITKSVNTGKL